MTKKNLIGIFCALALVLVYTACTKTNTGNGRNPCLEPKRYFINVRTYKPADTGIAGVDSNLPAPVIGYVDTNIIFYDGKWSGNNFNGPLSGTADSVRWFILTDTLKPSQRDTLVFHYTRKPVFLSTACGYAFSYSLQRLVTTNNAIDSTRIEKTEVNGAPDIIHVKVFY